jgi:NodT family efflux transporter outer membrane factor (OMF) lipoprotein
MRSGAARQEEMEHANSLPDGRGSVNQLKAASDHRRIANSNRRKHFRCRATRVASCANFASISGTAGGFSFVGPVMRFVPIATNTPVLRLLLSIPLLSAATMKFNSQSSKFVRLVLLSVVAISASVLTGCTSLHDYVHNGFQVGPNYHRPPALVADHWIDATDKRLRNENDNLCTWWAVMNDPVLNQMEVDAYQQNLTLREAGWRVMQSRAQLGIAVGNFFPQRQDATGSYQRIGAGQNFFSQWNFNFNLAWELDFWGRFRRAIQSAEDTLDASVFNYDDVLVTLLGDIADNYVQVRTNQERIRLLENTVKIQEDVYNFIDARLKQGVRNITDLDLAQAESDLKQSQAQLANLRIAVRLNENRLCTLLGIPTVDLEPLLKSAPNTDIPKVPNYLVVGMPADLLRRRPDVRRAERNAAAQAEFIGIAETDLYPAFNITGSLGWQAQKFSDLFSPQAFRGNVGPTFQWNLLNYGRIVNNVRFQDAGFQALVATYQNTVLNADEEVENGIITFLEAQDRARLLSESVDAANRALAVIVANYQVGAGAGLGDFNRYALIVQTLIQQQDQWAQARGQVDQGLIQVYRALGGGWQIRLAPNVDGLRMLPAVDVAPGLLPEQVAPPPAAGNLPAPNPNNPNDVPPLPMPGDGAKVTKPETVVPASAVATTGGAANTAPAATAIPTDTTSVAAPSTATTTAPATTSATPAPTTTTPANSTLVVPASTSPPPGVIESGGTAPQIITPPPPNVLRPIQIRIIDNPLQIIDNPPAVVPEQEAAAAAAPTPAPKSDGAPHWPAKPTANTLRP